MAVQEDLQLDELPLLKPPHPLDGVEMSVEKFYQLPDVDAFELIDGVVKEKVVGKEASFAGGEVIGSLIIWNRQAKFGRVGNSDAMVRVNPDRPNNHRRPDALVISHDRLARDGDHQGFIDVPPQLCVEVISEHDGSEDVNEKIDEYLHCGVDLVWAVHPRTRTVGVHHLADGRHVTVWYGANDELTGGDVLPGLVIPVAALFPPQVG